MRATPRSILAALGTVVVFAGLAISATPAFADAGSISADMNDMTLAANGGPGKVYPVFVSGGGALTNPVVTFDFTGIDGIATPSFPDPTSNCTVTGTSATCTLADVADGQYLDATIPLKLVPASGAKAGVKASISISASADGVDTDTEAAKVLVADGPDLVVPNTVVPDQKVKPGDHVDMPFQVGNLGSEPAKSVLLFFELSHGVQPDAYENCLYAPWPEDNGTIVLCDIEVTLNPGDGVSVDPGLTGVIAADSATFARSDLLVDSADLSDVSDAVKNSGFAPKSANLHFAKRTSTKTLTASAAEDVSGGEIDYNDNFVTWSYEVKTSYDLVGVGAKVVGNVGDTAKVKLGIKDNGPAALDTWSSHNSVVSFIVTVPDWAEAVGVPKNCQAESAPRSGDSGPKPGYPFYRCVDEETYFLAVHATYSETFTFKVKSATGKNGLVALDYEDGGGLADVNHADDTASITLAAPADAGLPVTGGKAGLISGAGVILVALGALMVFLGRRRKRTAAI